MLIPASAPGDASIIENVLVRAKSMSCWRRAANVGLSIEVIVADVPVSSSPREVKR